MRNDGVGFLNYEALAEFRREIRRFLNFSEHAARSAGIEPHQHQALLAIKGVPAACEATVGALADSLQIQHHSAVELSDRLEDKGLIRRFRSCKDRRAVLLHLTRRGEELLRRLSLHHHAELRSAGPKLLRALASAIAHSENRNGKMRNSGLNTPRGCKKKRERDSAGAKTFRGRH